MWPGSRVNIINAKRGRPTSYSEGKGDLGLTSNACVSQSSPKTHLLQNCPKIQRKCRFLGPTSGLLNFRDPGGRGQMGSSNLCFKDPSR